jgi:hypothetical protein
MKDNLKIMEYLPLILILFSTKITIAASVHGQQLRSPYRMLFYTTLILYFITITKLLKLENVKLDWLLSVALILLSFKFFNIIKNQPIQKHKTKYYIDLFSFKDLKSKKGVQKKGVLSIIIGVFQLQTLEYISNSIIHSENLLKLEYGLERTFQYYLYAAAIYLFFSGWTLIFYGFLQAYLLIPMKHVFDNPYCSKNPIDLWQNKLDLCCDIYSTLIKSESKPVGACDNSKNVYMYNEMFLMFISWGVFWEMFNFLTFGVATGEALLFFILNGILTCGYVFMDRNQLLIDEKPSNVSDLKAIVLHSFCQAYMLPLFLLPYVRVGFFD